MSNGDRYRLLFEEAREGIAITTPTGTIEEVNPAAANILGYSRKELQAMNVVELYVDPDDRKAAAEELRQKGALVDWELHFQQASGEPIICAVSATLRRDPEGNPKTYQTYFQDITEQKQTEKALAESEEKFHALSEHALVGIGVFQGDTFEHVNPELSALLGYSPRELQEASPKKFVHPDDWRTVQKEFDRCLEGKTQEFHYNARLQTSSGETRYVKVAGRRISYQGEPAVIGTFLDQTERTRLQREILQVQEEERRRLGQNLHDGVAAQLTGVTMKLDILEQKSEERCPDLSSRIQRVLELVKESNKDLRRISRGLNPVVLQDVGLLPALKRLAENTTNCTLQRKGLPPQLEGPSERFSSEEETHLYWIAQEAVANARRHADADEIVIRLRNENQGFALEVEDDGKGFPPEEMEQDETSQTELRDGLGLRTMRYRAEAMGADFSLESAPGDGTRVCCRVSD